MAEKRQCEFLLLRYVPDAVKNEFVNFGVLLWEPGNTKGENFAELRITRDWSRVRCIDPTADVEMLEALEDEIRTQLRDSKTGREAILKRVEDSFSNLVQLSGRKACITEDPQAEMEMLTKLYLESNRKGKRERDLGGRARIAGRMRSAFEDAGIWALMRKKIAVDEYTRSGDPLKIDCGYRPNGVVKMFHAIALSADPDPAKILAYSYPELAMGIYAKEKAKSELTAIVEMGLERTDERVEFAMSTLEKSAIKIATVGDLGMIAERARVELKA